MNLKQCLARKSQNDIMEILGQFEKALRYYSSYNFCFNEDLYSELTLVLLKCIHNFEFDEKGFTALFEGYFTSSYLTSINRP